MQLTKIFTVLSLAAASLAAPSVELYEKRTDSISCAQGQGKLACCEQKPELKPVSSLGSTFTPVLGGILGIPVSLLALLVPNVSVAAQCIPIISLINSCSANNLCCLAPSSGQSSNPGGLISILNNNQINVCPGITV